MPKKITDATTASPAPKDASEGDIGIALYSLGKEGGGRGIAETLYPLYQLEPLADNVGYLALHLDSLANATALATIARYGTDGERAKAVAILKGWFGDDFKD